MRHKCTRTDSRGTPSVQSTARKPEKRAGDESSGQVKHNMDVTFDESLCFSLVLDPRRAWILSLEQVTRSFTCAHRPNKHVTDLVNEMFGSKSLLGTFVKSLDVAVLWNDLSFFRSICLSHSNVSLSLFRCFSTSSSSFCSLCLWSRCWSSFIATAKTSVLSEYLLSSGMAAWIHK